MLRKVSFISMMLAAILLFGGCGVEKYPYKDSNGIIEHYNSTLAESFKTAGLKDGKEEDFLSPDLNHYDCVNPSDIASGLEFRPCKGVRYVIKAMWDRKNQGKDIREFTVECTPVILTENQIQAIFINTLKLTEKNDEDAAKVMKNIISNRLGGEPVGTEIYVWTDEKRQIRYTLKQEKLFIYSISVRMSNLPRDKG